jgi:hypothetical protein
MRDQFEIVGSGENLNNIGIRVIHSFLRYFTVVLATHSLLNEVAAS